MICEPRGTSSVDTGDSRRRLCSFLNSRFSALRDSTSGACCKYICRAFHCGYPIRSKNLGAKLSGTYELSQLCVIATKQVTHIGRNGKSISSLSLQPPERSGSVVAAGVDFRADLLQCQD